jgi:hypothetical protein
MPSGMALFALKFENLTICLQSKESVLLVKLLLLVNHFSWKTVSVIVGKNVPEHNAFVC